MVEVIENCLLVLAVTRVKREFEVDVDSKAPEAYLGAGGGFVGKENVPGAMLIMQSAFTIPVFF